jgi:hypothetical protein
MLVRYAAEETPFPRRLFNLAAAVSLLLCVISAALWVRGRTTWKFEGLTFNTRHDQGERHHSIETSPFGWKVSYHRLSGRPRLHLRWLPYSGASGHRDLWYGETGTSGFAGVWWYAGKPRGDGAGPMYELFVPHWLSALMTSILPAVWLMRWQKRRAGNVRGNCLTCGYDLRATPERCPECGVEVPYAAVR